VGGEGRVAVAAGSTAVSDTAVSDTAVSAVGSVVVTAVLATGGGVGNAAGASAPPQAVRKRRIKLKMIE
jgi:hypothetical protein